MIRSMSSAFESGVGERRLGRLVASVEVVSPSPAT